MARIEDPEGREVDVLRHLVDYRDRSVLDVGCGDGRTARRIARAASSVTGVDHDAERIAEARGTPAGNANLEFLVEDAVTLDFPAATFDAVVFSRSL